MLLPGAALLVLAVGLVLSAFGHGQLAATLWNGSALLAAVLLLVEILARLRRREIGVDLIALLAIVTAVLFGQALVAALVALMLASGRALESYSGRRAEHELRRLIDRAPRMAWRYRDSELEQVPVEHIRAGDRLLVRLGEMVPVDGVVLDKSATLDESALTGEPLPVRREPGDTLRSGALNAGTPFEMRASHPATEHLCRHSADGRGRTPVARTFRAPGRSLCPAADPRHAGPGRHSLADQWRPAARAGGTGGGHPLPAYSGRTYRNHVRHFALRAPRYPHQGWRHAGSTGSCQAAVPR